MGTFPMIGRLKYEGDMGSVRTRPMAHGLDIIILAISPSHGSDDKS